MYHEPVQNWKTFWVIYMSVHPPSMSGSLVCSRLGILWCAYCPYKHEKSVVFQPACRMYTHALTSLCCAQMSHFSQLVVRMYFCCIKAAKINIWLTSQISQRCCHFTVKYNLIKLCRTVTLAIRNAHYADLEVCRYQINIWYRQTSKSA